MFVVLAGVINGKVWDPYSKFRFWWSSKSKYAYGEFYVTCEDDDINNKSEMEFVVGVSDGNTFSEQYQTPVITVSVHWWIL